jgi:hypothetical protein
MENTMLTRQEFKVQGLAIKAELAQIAADFEVSNQQCIADTGMTIDEVCAIQLAEAKEHFRSVARANREREIQEMWDNDDDLGLWLAGEID